MKIYYLIAIFVSFSLPVFADSVDLERSGISFEPPLSFQQLSSDLIKIKYPRPNPPKWVYSNDDATVSVAIKHSNVPITNQQLPQLLKEIEQGIPQGLPNVVWLKKEVAIFNNITWLHVEFTHSGIDTDIHNHIYMTNHRGGLLAVNFNATVEQYKKFEKELQKSFNSIRLK